jgi:hypothetical protein
LLTAKYVFGCSTTESTRESDDVISSFVSDVFVAVFAKPTGAVMFLEGGPLAAATVIGKFFVKFVLAVSPFSTVAVSVTVPAAVGVTDVPLIDPAVRPAPAVFTDQMIVLCVAVAGTTVALLRLIGVPTVPVSVTPVMSVTATNAGAVSATVKDISFE